MDEKRIAAIKKIDILSKKIGLDDESEKTVLQMEKTDDPNKKLLTLQSGKWDTQEPWFVIDDESEKVYTMLSLDTLLGIIKSLRVAQEENFNLKLEKSIWQNMPIDFQDVWVVAMDEIKKELKNPKDKKSLNINIDNVIKDIKKKYPNLFLNIDMYLNSENLKDLT